MAKKKAGQLTVKQQAFVNEYLKDGNATRAYRAAGYRAASDGVAHANSSALLRNHKVSAAVEAARKIISERALVTAEDVVRELKKVAFSDIGHVLDFTGTNPTLRPACDVPEDARRALSSVKVRRVFEGSGDDAAPVDVIEFKLWDKLAALDKLARHLGMFVEKHEVTGKGGGPIEFIITPGPAKKAKKDE